MDNKSAAAERNIPTLDGWRAIAILTVLLCHGVPPGSLLWPLRIFGTHGVYVFFGISGFLITSKLLVEESRRGINLSEFYLRRAFRILPPALTFITLVAVLGLVGVLSRMPLKEWLVDAFFLQSYVGKFDGRSEYTVHFWSLSVEEHFYLVFPFLLAFMGSKRLRVLVPILCVAAAAWRLIDDRFVDLHQTFSGIFPNYRTDRIFDLLLYGCLLALAFQSDRVKATLTRVLRPWVLAPIGAVFVLTIWKQPPFAITIEGLCVSLLLAGTVLHSGSLFGKLLDSAPMRFVGRISYSLYLWQQLFFVASFRKPELLQRFPLNLFAVLALALASYHFVELPLIALGRSVIARRRARAATVQPVLAG